MSGKLESQVISAPGFKGLNSQDASADLPDGFALTASNCVIDKFGRVGSRKGTTPLDATTIGKVEYLGEVNGSILVGTATAFYLNGIKAFDATKGHVTQSASIAFYQGGPSNLVLVSSVEVPLRFDGSKVTALAIAAYPPGMSVDDFKPSTIISGFGRLWAAGPNGGSILYFCDTLNPLNWATGSAGKLDLTTIVGEDTITGMAIHNNSIVIFLRNNILIYSGASNPAGLALTDTINGLGCIARFSIQCTGEDVIFLSRTGIRSLNRTVQEKSAPLSELSKNVRDALMEAVSASSEPSIKSVYSQENSFYLLSIPEATTTYCFDTRIQGQWRATTWTLAPTALLSTIKGALLFGGASGPLKYGGYNDSGKSFRMAYATSWITAGVPTTIKILKKLSTIVVGGGASLTLKTAWDYRPHSVVRSLPIKGRPVSLFGQALFGQALFARGPTINSTGVSAGGSGCALQVSVEADVYNEAVSIQTIGLYMKIGKSL